MCIRDSPYTKALMQAIPTRDVARGALQGLAGAVPDLINPPPGCRFAARCVLARPACLQGAPAVHDAGSAHRVACPVVQEVSHA